MWEYEIYADLHVHSTFKSFWGQNVETPWSDVKNLTDNKIANRTTQVTRSDLSSCIESNTRLISLNITTIERFSLTRIFTQPLIVAKLLKFDLGQLRKALSTRPFQMFQEEFDFLKKHATDEKGREVVFVRNFTEIDETLKNPNKIAALLSVEGSHCLGFEYFDEQFPGGKLQSAEIPEVDLIRDRVKFLKDNGFFYLTLNHFVYNHLATMPKAIELSGFKKIIRNPIGTLSKIGDYRGLTFLGYQMVKACFDNKIVLDIKHCDAITRNQLYHIAKDANFPLISSHMAVSGRKTNIKDNQHVVQDDTVKSRLVSDRFNPWDINFHDDDLIAIHKLGGLMGLIMDRRVLSGEKYLLQITKQHTNSSILIYNQLEYIYETLVKNGIPAETAFDSVCLGSDFDGMIEPIINCTTVKDYPNLEKDLTHFFEINQAKYKDSGLSPEQIVNKFMRKNMIEFLKKYFV